MILKRNNFSSIECWSKFNSYSGCVSIRKWSTNWNKNGYTRASCVSFGWNESFSRSLNWSHGI